MKSKIYHKAIAVLKVLWLLLSPMTAFLAFLVVYEAVDFTLGLFLDNTNFFKIFIPIVIAIYLSFKLFRWITGIGFGKEKKEDAKYYPPLSGALSVYNERLYEFQVERTLIYIDIEALGEEESIKRGNEDFDTFWRKRDEALVVAEKASRMEHPQLWKKHDKMGIKEHPLELWSIHYDAKSRSFSYDFYTSNAYPLGEDAPPFPEGELMECVYYDKDKGLYVL